VIERLYSSGVYRWLQPTVTTASNLAPFALLDALILLVAAAWIATAIRDVRGCGWVRALARVVTRTATWAAALYLLFLALWGLNYRRERLAQRMALDASAVTSGAARQLAEQTVDRLNALHEDAHAIGWPAAGTIDPTLASSFASANRDLHNGIVVIGRPKATLLEWYLRRASVDGMTDPFFLEALVSSDVLPFEQPFVVAHEWSHLAGLANEGEANFLGWLACARGSDADRYSGWLFLYQEAMALLSARERTVIAARLAPGPRGDLRAIADRVARSRSPVISAAGWRVYDQYLKANRVEEGTRSYAEVIRLILGTKVGAASRHGP
jgi:hypothetical protein